MKTLKIKTYSTSAHYDDSHIFLLSKGYNAGKPLEKPCANCFIISTESKQEKYQLFWICYSLWKSGAFLPVLCGSVIEFLRIQEASSVIEKAMQRVDARKIEFEKEVAQLQRLIKTERLLEKQLSIIDQVKGSLARRLIR